MPYAVSLTAINSDDLKQCVCMYYWEKCFFPVKATLIRMKNFVCL